MQLPGVILITIGVVVALACLLAGDIMPLFDGPRGLHHLFWLSILLAGLVVAVPSWRTAARALVFWGGLGLIAIIGYAYRDDLEGVASNVMGELVPGRAIMSDDKVELARRGDGHFHVVANIGESRLSFLVDSGASMVVLNYEDARRAGLPVETLRFGQPVSTANGHTTVARVMLDTVSIGSIIERNVPAAVAQPGDLDTNLLGLSFLDRMSEWGVINQRFVMKP